MHTIVKSTVVALALLLGVSNSAHAAKICSDLWLPVCATKDGAQKTYGNQCMAKADGATNIKPGACEDPEPKQQTFCPLVVLPVCAKKDGEERSYTNACFALANQATIIHKGKCGSTK